MLKRIALAGIFLFASAFAFADASHASSTQQTSTKASAAKKAPSTPPAKGFCWPPGIPC